MNNSIRIFVSIIALFFATEVFSQYKYTLAVGGSHERQFAASGVHLRLYYNLHEHIHFSAAYGYYFEDTEKSDVESITRELRSLNLNFNYVIYIGKKLGFYPIIGFNYTFGSEIVVNEDALFEDFTETIGMNIGFGVSYQMGRFRPYLESTSVLNYNSFLVYAAGLSYSFGKSE